jgi:hypothetical protein
LIHVVLLLGKFFYDPEKQFNGYYDVDGAKKENACDDETQNILGNCTKKRQQQIPNCEQDNKSHQKVPFAADYASRDVFFERSNEIETVDHDQI